MMFNFIAFNFISSPQSVHSYLQFFCLSQHLFHKSVQAGCSTLHCLSSFLFAALKLISQSNCLTLHRLHFLHHFLLVISCPSKLIPDCTCCLLDSLLYFFQSIIKLSQSHFQNFFIFTVVNHHLCLKTIQRLLNLSL